MWSVGCIFAELLHGKPILPGKNEPEQIQKIFELCGTPDESNWPGVSKLPWYNNFKPSKPIRRRIRETFRNFDRHALELVEKMLTLDPSQRISAKDALDAEYFWTDPVPCSPSSLPKYEASHEFQTKKKRQQQRQYDEMAKRQKISHPQQHVRLPPMQTGGQQNPMPLRPGPNQQPMHNPTPSVPVGPHYAAPRGAAGAQTRHPQGVRPMHGGQGGGYNSNRGYGPPQQQGGGYHGHGMGNQGPRGGAYGVRGTGYSQGGAYGGPVGGRGPNMGGNRGQQFGWD
eukprot:TRINITY_DN3867_c0_g2_i1.p1 TRINITY_DN3867_c0_g2~~TRINITY_DN3867_c0_g2_i1.p1  ORF type:complete len:284 (-),score=67.64 TRINITY_DN3867_c0_g2_i1:764-1615(-)